MFPTEALDPELRQLMERTFAEACLEIDVASMLEYGKAAETMMALRIMTTVAAGERDPGRLKDLALQAVDGRAVSYAAKSDGYAALRAGSEALPAM